MKSVYKYILPLVAIVLLSGCRDHEPKVEDLPTDAVSFEYSIPGSYALDYYVDSEVLFVNTSPTAGTAIWDFGDNTTAEGDSVLHAYSATGTYTVTLTIRQADGSTLQKKQPLFISDIKPLLTLNPIQEEICEVLTTRISFSMQLPNPKNRTEEYQWIFPEGTRLLDNTPVDTVFQKIPPEVVFSNVGSQAVRLQAKLDGRPLEEVSVNVQVGYNKEVPTLYYAVRGGNIMALKLAADAPEDMKIMPFDLGVSSGQHAFNILFADSSVYMLDAGQQFYYVDDSDGVLGDGKISVIAKDGSKVETLITNVGQAAFDDPFYGYIEDGTLYYANRNTGIIAVRTKERNRIYSATEFPYYVQHSTLGYYGRGIEYGAIGGMFGKVEGTWYWTKFYNANGIFRFTDADIYKEPVTKGAAPTPEAGVALSTMYPKSFAYNAKTKEFFFTVFDEGSNGFYRCPSLAALDAIGNSKTILKQYKILHESGKELEVNTSGKPALYEGTGAEVVGVCQMVLDEATGCVYFGFRSDGSETNAPSGLMRYNPATGKVETVIEGVEIYGVTINPNPSKLF